MSEKNRPSRSMWTPGRDTRTGGCTPTDIKEEQLLFQALSPCVRRICVFIANTGLRVTEAITLQQHQFFDFKYGSKGNRLTVEVVGLDPKDTKGNYERIIPLNSDAVKAKNEALEYNGDKFPEVFLNELGEPYSPENCKRSIRRAMHRACKRQGIRNINPHDLRSRLVGRLVENRIGVTDIKDMMANISYKVLERYVVTSESKIKAVQSLESESTSETVKTS